jgi:hypothetical protein
LGFVPNGKEIHRMILVKRRLPTEEHAHRLWGAVAADLHHRDDGVGDTTWSPQRRPPSHNCRAHRTLAGLGDTKDGCRLSFRLYVLMSHGLPQGAT